jgi:hypothetical protein
VRASAYQENGGEASGESLVSDESRNLYEVRRMNEEVRSLKEKVEERIDRKTHENEMTVTASLRDKHYAFSSQP